MRVWAAACRPTRRCNGDKHDLTAYTPALQAVACISQRPAHARSVPCNYEPDAPGGMAWRLHGRPFMCGLYHSFHPAAPPARVALLAQDRVEWSSPRAPGRNVLLVWACSLLSEYARPLPYQPASASHPCHIRDARVNSITPMSRPCHTRVTPMSHPCHTHGTRVTHATTVSHIPMPDLLAVALTLASSPRCHDNALNANLSPPLLCRASSTTPKP
eukprot:359172-Chlamydomonas_euryale.AAC.3